MGLGILARSLLHTARGRAPRAKVNRQRSGLTAQVTAEARRLGPAFPRFGIFVPCYDAERHIASTLARIPRELAGAIAEIFVFDDASRDRTFEVAQQYAAASDWGPKLKVVRHERNLGYGGNQISAFHYAIEQGFDAVIMVHGDGQYAPEFLAEIMAEMLHGRCEAVFASRMIRKADALAGGMPLYKWLGNQALTWLQNLVLGTSLHEFHTGYRAYRVETLKRIPFYENCAGFAFDTQIIIQLRAISAAIIEIPVATHYGDEVCHVNGLKYAVDVIKAVFEYRLHQLHLIRRSRYLISRESLYTRKASPYGSHETILAMVRGPGRLLDVGCSQGTLTEDLRRREFATVGVDITAPAGPAHSMEAFHHCDLERGLKIDAGRDFDYVIMADVIEHIRAADQLLENVARYLKFNGYLLISTPNIANWYVRLSLLLGRFNYGDKGILDRTHVHFYTLDTFRTLLLRNGFELMEMHGTSLPFEIVFESTGRSPVFRLLDRLYFGLVRLWPRLFAYQFVAKARLI